MNNWDLLPFQDRLKQAPSPWYCLQYHEKICLFKSYRSKIFKFIAFLKILWYTTHALQPIFYRFLFCLRLHMGNNNQHHPFYHHHGHHSKNLKLEYKWNAGVMRFILIYDEILTVLIILRFITWSSELRVTRCNLKWSSLQ